MGKELEWLHCCRAGKVWLRECWLKSQGVKVTEQCEEPGCHTRNGWLNRSETEAFSTEEAQEPRLNLDWQSMSELKSIPVDGTREMAKTETNDQLLSRKWRALQLLEKDLAAHSSVLAWRTPGTGGAWWAAVYGVAQSWTRLERLSSSSATVDGNA